MNAGLGTARYHHVRVTKSYKACSVADGVGTGSASCCSGVKRTLKVVSFEALHLKWSIKLGDADFEAVLD